MPEERTYEFDESVIEIPEDQAAREEATRTAFITNLKNAQLGHILNGIKEELLNANRDILEANNFLDDFSNFRIVKPSDERVFTIVDTTGEKAPIYIDENDELRPVYDIIMAYNSKDEILNALVPYQELLERHELSDILTVGKYDFGNIPKSYTVGVITPEDGKKIAKTVDYKNPELFNIMNQYSERITSDVVASAYKEIEEFTSSKELIDIYNYIKNSFDETLEQKSLSADELAKADELFAKIPHYDSVIKTAENEFCFEALKQAYQAYQLEPKLGKVWLQLPEQVQKEPEVLKHAITDGVVKDSGSRKIKSKVKNVEKMTAKQTLKQEDIDDIYKTLFDNGFLLPLEKIQDYTNKMSEPEKEEFLKQIDAMNAIYNKKLDKTKSSDDVILKPKNMKWHLLKNISNYFKFRISDSRLKKTEKRFKLYYKNPFGENSITISQLFEEEKENDTPVPLNLLMKISGKAAKELKVTKDASEKLVENNLENVDTNVIPVENKYDVLNTDELNKSEEEKKDISSEHGIEEPVILSTTAEDKTRENPIIPPAIETQIQEEVINETSESVKEQNETHLESENFDVSNETRINVSIQDLEGKSKEEIITMIQNGSILSSFSLEDIEKEAEQRREEQQHEQYLQRQKEGLENFKKKHIIENAKLHYADDPEKLNDYLVKNNISQLEWELQKPLSETEEQDIVQEREKQQQEYEYNRQDFIDYAASLSGIDRYTLLHGVPGEEDNEYGVTNADVEKYIQSRENVIPVVESDLENGKSK